VERKESVVLCGPVRLDESNNRPGALGHEACAGGHTVLLAKTSCPLSKTMPAGKQHRRPPR